MRLSLFHDQPDSSTAAASLSSGDLADKLQRIITVISPNGYAPDPAGTALRTAAEISLVETHIEDIRAEIKRVHRTKIQFVIWAVADGLCEQTAMYQSVGLLKSAPRLYLLDSADPAKLTAIWADMSARSRLSSPELLRRTLIVVGGHACSQESMVNLTAVASHFQRFGVDGSPNIVCLAQADSSLGTAAATRGLRLLPSTSGEEAGLYALALGGVDLRQWKASGALDEVDIDSAFRLAAFLHCQLGAGRDKLTLLTPRGWAGVGSWTKQTFDAKLNDGVRRGPSLVVGEKIRPLHYRSPKEPRQDRVFVSIQVKGLSDPETQKVTLLRRAGYPVAVVVLSRPQLPVYTQLIRYCVYGLAWLEQYASAARPKYERYWEIAGGIHAEASAQGGIEHTSSWTKLHDSSRKSAWLGRLTLLFDGWPLPFEAGRETAPALYCRLLRQAVQDGSVQSAELTHFGDLRYSESGKSIDKVLKKGADRLFRTRLKMPASVCESPLMNYASHELSIGRERCFSTIVVTLPADGASNHAAGFHTAQFLAMRETLVLNRRFAVCLLLKNREPASIRALEQFFSEAARVWQSTRS